MSLSQLVKLLAIQTSQPHFANLTFQTKPKTCPENTTLTTKSSKSNLAVQPPNPTLQTKPCKLNLTNKTFKTKPCKPNLENTISQSNLTNLEYKISQTVKNLSK